MLENYFKPYRTAIIGADLISKTSGKPILYADWTASGKLYRPIEEHILNELGPYVANPHTENTETGRITTRAYHDARATIKSHVNADHRHALICTGAGATSAINKLQRILGLKTPQPTPSFWQKLFKPAVCRPAVFVTHMEHHSNQTSWNTCNVDVFVVNRAPDGQPCYKHLEALLKEHKARPLLIGAFTACSNVTGVQTDVRRLARLMHQAGGIICVDYACSAPYVEIDMTPDEPDAHIDAIYFSPHKFLGGPGTAGVLIFDKTLYTLNECAPDKPGGGTVMWTNPWGEQAFYKDIEKREDGGTPPFLQVIKAGLAINLKDQMGVDKIATREAHLRRILMNGISAIDQVQILEPNAKNRLCIVSFYATGIHHNLIVWLLNDKFGIQARGGCSCAGTYGHILLNVDRPQSDQIVSKVNRGDLADKPGWVRVSLHPTNTDEEAYFVVDAIKSIVANIDEWQKDYEFNPKTGDFMPINSTASIDTVPLKSVQLYSA